MHHKSLIPRLKLILAGLSCFTFMSMLFVTTSAKSASPLSLDDFQNRKAEDIKPQDVIHWEAFNAVQQTDGSVIVTARLSAKQDWTIYQHNLNFSGPAGYTLSDMKGPPTKTLRDPISGKDVDVYAGGEFELRFSGAVNWQGASFPFSVSYVGCTQVICLFPHKEALEVPFTATTASTAISSDIVDESQAAAKITAPPPVAELDFEAQLAQQLSSGALSYGMLLVVVFLGGLLSNLTPCVYPMIPITLRVLSRQGHAPWVSASTYALGIIITYSTLGIVAALSGGLFGSLLASKPINVAFAVVMLLLGLSMLGFGDLSKIQMLGSRLGSGKPSLKNTFLMGAGAGLVAAPCTGPILAALLLSTAKTTAKGQDIWHSVSLMITYSVGFGLPYIILGGAAARVARVKVHPAIQVAVKLLFAAVMFALALYYLRVPFYQQLIPLKAHWQNIASVCLAVGGLLALIWVIAPALQNNKLSMILPTLILGVGIFTGVQWATSAKVEAGAPTLNIVRDEASAFALAKQMQRPILIDMWAEWCEACKKMDSTTFVDPEVIKTLNDGWVVLKLDLTETTPQNDAILAKYQLQGLPTLVLLPADGDLQKMHTIVAYADSATLLAQLRAYPNK